MAAEPDRIDASGRRRVLRPRITVETDDDRCSPSRAPCSPHPPARPRRHASCSIDATSRRPDQGRPRAEGRHGPRRSRPSPAACPSLGELVCYAALQRPLPAASRRSPSPRTPRGRTAARRRRTSRPTTTPGRPGHDPPPPQLADPAERQAGDRGSWPTSARARPRRGGRLPARRGQVHAGRDAAAELADAGEKVMVIAQTNEQVDDLTDRLAAARPGLAIGRLSGRERVHPVRARDRPPEVTVSAKLADLAGCPVVLGTAHKWATVRAEAAWPWAIVDEAYQMRSDLLLRVAGPVRPRAVRRRPRPARPVLARWPDQRWTGLTWDPMQSAVAVLLRHNPDIPVHPLPVSWRLPASAAPVVAEAFYPFTGFRAATGREQRRVEFSARPFGRNALDTPLETAADPAGRCTSCPARHTVRTDAEAVAACAALAARVLQRGAISYSERSVAGAPVTADRIAVGTAHRDQAAGHPRDAAGRRPARHHRGHRQPPAGPRVRRGDRAAPAVRPPRRHGVPPGSGPPVRARPPGTATPASSSPGPASPSCSTPTPPPSRYT